MKQYNLTAYTCPQQFVQFKLALKDIQLAQQGGELILDAAQSYKDIEAFLIKKQWTFKKYYRHTHLIISLEPNPCV